MRQDRPGTPSDIPIAVGVDVGATAIKAAVVDLRGNLVESFREPSPRTPGALHDFVHSVVKRAPASLRGIGIGCKGVIDTTSSRVNSLPGDLNFLEGSILAKVVSAGDIPLYSDNDARTALIAEVLWGAARGKRNVVMLTLGTGVGGAALVDGVMLRGASGAAGHLGHMTLDLHGGLCICGNYGCVETRFSSRAIESDYLAHLHRAAPASLSVDHAGQPPTTEAIFRAAAGEDESARRVLDRAFEYLAAALACRTAIRAGDPLSSAQMASLVEAATHQRLAYACPHGRPTHVTLSLAELERRFLRLTSSSTARGQGEE